MLQNIASCLIVKVCYLGNQNKAFELQKEQLTQYLSDISRFGPKVSNKAFMRSCATKHQIMLNCESLLLGKLKQGFSTRKGLTHLVFIRYIGFCHKSHKQCIYENKCYKTLHHAKLRESVALKVKTRQLDTKWTNTLCSHPIQLVLAKKSQKLQL